jgi:ADP-glucose pyrophosphorylase
MSNAVIEGGSSVKKAIIGSNAIVKSQSRIGFALDMKDEEIAYVDEGATVEEYGML